MGLIKCGHFNAALLRCPKSASESALKHAVTVDFPQIVEDADFPSSKSALSTHVKKLRARLGTRVAFFIQSFPIDAYRSLGLQRNTHTLECMECFLETEFPEVLGQVGGRVQVLYRPLLTLV